MFNSATELTRFLWLSLIRKSGCRSVWLKITSGTHQPPHFCWHWANPLLCGTRCDTTCVYAAPNFMRREFDLTRSYRRLTHSCIMRLWCKGHLMLRDSDLFWGCEYRFIGYYLFNHLSLAFYHPLSPLLPNSPAPQTNTPKEDGCTETSGDAFFFFTPALFHHSH